MSKFHAIYSKGGDTPGPEPEPSTGKLVYLGDVSDDVNISSAAAAAGLDTHAMVTEKFILTPKSWVTTAESTKAEGLTKSANYSINYNSETTTLTVSSQPNARKDGIYTFAKTTFNVYYFTGEVSNG